MGILGLAVIAVTMFLSTNNTNNSSSDLSLAGLMSVNLAHASCESNTDPYGGGCTIPKKPESKYFRFGTYVWVEINNPSTTTSLSVQTQNGTTVTASITSNSGRSYGYWDCEGWFGDC